MIVNPELDLIEYCIQEYKIKPDTVIDIGLKGNRYT